MKKLLILASILTLIVAAPAFGCDKAKAAKMADASYNSVDTNVFHGLNVQPTVTRLDNGVKIIVVNASQDDIAAIENRMGSCPKSSGCTNCPIKANGVTRSVKRTDDGLVIMATADDAELVSKIHEYASKISS
ncbi:MAG: hypothetical protein JSV80_14980 [Acidobacteriota bacterium]|nr:MAG: hypothetical protein JSV80_14980 [Acidobacteriota bacterium]